VENDRAGSRPGRWHGQRLEPSVGPDSIRLRSLPRSRDPSRCDFPPVRVSAVRPAGRLVRV